MQLKATYPRCCTISHKHRTDAKTVPKKSPKPLPPKALSRIPTPFIEKARSNLQSTQRPIPRNNINFLNNLIEDLYLLIDSSPILFSPNNPKYGMPNQHIPPLQFIHSRSIPLTLQVNEQIIRGKKIKFKPQSDLSSHLIHYITMQEKM